MDIFFEQIVKKRKTLFEKLTIALIWLAGWLLCVGVVLLVFAFPDYILLALLAAVGIVYGTFKLSSRLNLEYEYSVTNDSLDVDKIINRSDRKRLISLDISSFDRFEEFDPHGNFDPKRYDQVVMAVADPAGEGAIYAAVTRHPSKGRILLLFQPNEKILQAVRQALPRTLKMRRADQKESL